jgi:hypothetical protein
VTNTYWVDFNDVKNGGYIRIPYPHEVAMIDAEGNFCMGDVMGIDGEHLLVRPNFDTWADGSHQPIEGEK